MTDRDTDRAQDEPPPSPELQQLLALARKSLSGNPPKRHASSLQQVQGALERRELRRRRSVWAASATGAVIAGCLLFLWLRPEAAAAPLRFEVQQGALSASGVVEGTERGTRLQFSDGTLVALAASGRAHVDSINSHGAEVGLDRGRVKLDVVRRPGARWSVRAGPYLVEVTGTSFEVEFDPEQLALKLELLEGAVSVSGPSIDGALRLSAGQQLLVRPGEAPVLARREPEAAQPVEPAARIEPPTEAAVADVGAPSSALRYVPQRPRAARAAQETWRQKVAAAHFEEVIALAEAKGLSRVYRQAPLEELEALADAARYARRVEIARAALLALRARFAGSRPARDAGFLLGRLEEGAGAVEEARAWYERYSSEEPNGDYAAQAQGRLLLLLRERSPAQARALAQQYLQRHPRGPHAAIAQELAQDLAREGARESADGK